MLPRRQVAYQPAPLPRRQVRIGRLTHQLIPEQRHRLCAFGTHPPLVVCRCHQQPSSTLDEDRRVSRVDDQTSAAQGELVLIDPGGQPGASNRPDDAAPTTCHTVTPVTANRADTATTAACIAATASAHTDPADPGSTGSAATAHNRPVNQPRAASAREPKRRNHSRTVPSGRSTSPAIGRAPNPAAFATIAAPTTPTASARRSSTPTGSSTCVPPHPRHTARRGRTNQPPDSVRTTRARACPHPVSTPEQPRTCQLTPHQPPLDLGRIHAYRQHRCLRAPPRGPP